MLGQDATPYLDALVTHADARPNRFNVPAHKGGKRAPARLVDAIGARALELDIPPLIDGIDTGALPTPFEQAQRLAASAWGARRSWFVVNGASHANHAACLALARCGDEVIVQRNVHTSVIDGLIISGLRPRFVAPELDDLRGIPHCVTPGSLAAALDQARDPAGVIVVSPSYYGTAADVIRLVEVAHARGVPIVVDEAWGAHFAHHSSLPTDAIAAGADLVISSTHKMLGSLTQSAMLHLGPAAMLDEAVVDHGVSVLESTSPSALLSASLDAARHLAVTAGGAMIGESLEALAVIRQRIRELPGYDVLDEGLIGTFGVAGVDPFRLCVDAIGTRISGYEIQRHLRAHENTHVELASKAVLVAIFGMGDTLADGEPLVRALKSAIQALDPDSPALPTRRALPPVAPLVSTPREAFFADHLRLPIAEAIGRVAAESLAVYPPGIPNVLPGERLTRPVVQHILEAAADGAVIRGASDRTLQTIRVVDHRPGTRLARAN